MQIAAYFSLKGTFWEPSNIKLRGEKRSDTTGNYESCFVVATIVFGSVERLNMNIDKLSELNMPNPAVRLLWSKPFTNRK